MPTGLTKNSIERRLQGMFLRCLVENIEKIISLGSDKCMLFKKKGWCNASAQILQTLRWFFFHSNCIIVILYFLQSYNIKWFMFSVHCPSVPDLCMKSLKELTCLQLISMNEENMDVRPTGRLYVQCWWSKGSSCKRIAFLLLVKTSSHYNAEQKKVCQ